ncbi:MAG: fused MFS/spermidine synthase, partial [Proteobacteria bacterium]|nr:fused MFS/spermidine synthase [Pseudomonadota bacterium]
MDRATRDECRMLAVVVLLSSAAALAVELAAARLLAPMVGMSLFTWTAIISVVLAGFSVGHWIGGVLASRAGDIGLAGRWLALALALAGLTAAAVAGLPLAPDIIELAGGVRVTTVMVLATALFFIPSLAAGAISPLATAIAVEIAGPGA